MVKYLAKFYRKVHFFVIATSEISDFMVLELKNYKNMLEKCAEYIKTDEFIIQEGFRRISGSIT